MEGTSPKRPWASWIVSLVPVALLLFSAAMKLMRHPAAVEGFAKFGYPPASLFWIGVVELTCTVLYIIPRTSILGAILLTGYLGGAVNTHVRAGEPFLSPVVVGILLWLGIYLREDRLRALVPWRK